MNTTILDTESTLLPSIIGNAQIAGNIASDLTTLDATYKSANAQIQNFLIEQNAISGILDTETNRLQNKKNNIDDALSGKIRASQLNESYRKRRAAYMRLMIVICVTIIIYLLVSYLSKIFPFLSGIAILIYIILFFVSIVYILYILKEIYTRDMIDYDTLNIPGPKVYTPAEVLAEQRKAAEKGDLIGTVADSNRCVGETCCTEGSNTWNAGNNRCEGLTLLSNSDLGIQPYADPKVNFSFV